MSYSILLTKAVKSRRFTVWIFLLALLLRVFAAVAIGSWHYPVVDGMSSAGWETGEIAYWISHGRGFSIDLLFIDGGTRPTAWIAPLYPYLLGAVFWLLGPYSPTALATVVGIQILLSSMTAAALCRLGKRTFGHGVGALAGLLFALAPSAINICTRIIWGTTLLALQVVVLSLLCIPASRGAPSARRSVLIGAWGAGMILNSPASSLMMPAIALWLTIRYGRLGIARTAQIAITSALMLAPWMVRNYLEYDRIFFVKSNFGNELFVGNNPEADGRYHRAGDTALRVMGRERLHALAGDELTWSDGLGKEARAWICENPLNFASLTLSRIWRYWTAPFLTDWSALPVLGRYPLTAIVYRVAQVLILLLAALGASTALKRGSSWLPGAFLIAFPIPYYLTHVDITRYRFPVVPLVFLFASVGVVWIAARLPRGYPPSNSSRMPD